MKGKMKGKDENGRQQGCGRKCGGAEGVLWLEPKAAAWYIPGVEKHENKWIQNGKRADGNRCKISVSCA